jgi:HEPN domain-containing protein
MENPTAKRPQEWLKQADYDMDTAKFMLSGGRNFYAVFMCHLSVEKALKGLYQHKLDQMPPKIHNLWQLLDKIGLEPPTDIGQFLTQLNEANVITRYPQDIEVLQKTFSKSIVQNMLTKGGGALEWIKKQL